MPTYADKQTDKELAKIERHIARIYKEAGAELTDIWNKYIDGYDEKVGGKTIHHKSLEERRLEEYEAYLKGKYTKEQYDQWYEAQVGRGKRWEALKDEMANRMTNANKIASAYINDNTPGIYSLNANFTAFEIEKASGVAFNLVNETTIRNLMLGENHSEFRVLSVNPKRDYEWNTKKIQNALTSGIIQGNSIPKMVDRFLEVMGTNKNAAIRNARTAVTSAQNGGRQSTYNKAKEMGIEMEKEWIATHDKRTRDSHAQMDGVRVENDEAFPNGLMYPGDPSGEPSEVYNCRCTMRAILPRYNGEKRTENTKETYEEWKKSKEDAKAQNTTNTVLSAPQSSGQNQKIEPFNNLNMDQKYKDDATDILNKCTDDDLKHAFEVQKSNLKVTDPNCPNGAFYSERDKGVHINMKKISQETEEAYSYETLFHELGHNIDYAVNPKGYSYVYRDSNGSSLYDVMKADYAKLVNLATGGVKMKKADASAKVIAYVQGNITDVKGLSCMSDMLESFTGVGYPLRYDDVINGKKVTYGFGHGTTYWTKNYGREAQTTAEFFAEVCESLAVNPESAAILQTYFPTGVKMVKEMLGGL